MRAQAERGVEKSVGRVGDEDEVVVEGRLQPQSDVDLHPRVIELDADAAICDLGRGDEDPLQHETAHDGLPCLGPNDLRIAPFRLLGAERKGDGFLERDRPIGEGEPPSSARPTPQEVMAQRPPGSVRLLDRPYLIACAIGGVLLVVEQMTIPRSRP